MFCFARSSKIIIFELFCYIFTLFSSFSLTRSLLIPYEYVSIELTVSFYHHLNLKHCQKEKIKKVIRLMKDALGGKIMKQFLGLRAKTYNYLIDDENEDKKAKGTKRRVIKKN